MLLAAGRGVRFRPVTESIPKPLFPYLNLPLIHAHMRRLASAGVTEIGINLHHLGEAIERHLSDHPAATPHVRFFREPVILGTAGALANAADWLAGGGDFLVVNSDAAIDPDFAGLLARHRESGRSATLLVTENPSPARFTPLVAQGDCIVGFGAESSWPLLYTGVCVLSSRVLGRIASGERSLVADLWQPMLDRHEEIGWVFHREPFSDLGTPRDFLGATRQALTRGGPFAPEAGAFDSPTRVLSLTRSRSYEAVSSVVGRASIGRGARLIESAVWDGVEIGERAELTGCIAAGGRIPAQAVHHDALLWGRGSDIASAYPLS
jgi:mannose-1-phosphate guanylyltransferase